MLLIETAHSFGICIFVFRVLPTLDLARAILLMNAVCTVPGILKLLLSKNHVSTAKRLVIFIMDICAVSMQITVFGIVFASKYMLKTNTSGNVSGGSSPSGGGGGGSSGETSSGDSFDAGGAALDPVETTESVFDAVAGADARLKRHLNYTVSMLIGNLTTTTTATAGFAKRSLLGTDYDDLFDASQTSVGSGGGGGSVGGGVIGSGSGLNSSMNYILEDILASFQIEWELPIALMLVSLVWWENFVDRDIKFGSYKVVNMKLLKENIIATRYFINGFGSYYFLLSKKLLKNFLNNTNQITEEKKTFFLI